MKGGRSSTTGIAAAQGALAPAEADILTADRLPGRTLAPLRHRNYRLLWTGLVVSNTGTWMQFTAIGYLVDQLTLSPLYLGYLGLAQGIPRVLFAFVGGVVADRGDRRRVLLLTNLVAMASATLLAVLTYLDLIRVWHLLVIGAFNSFVHAFDMPARQSMTPALVGEADLLQAVSLNSVAFNGAGIFGPALGGLVISLVGTHGAFALNAVSYLAVLWALLAMRVPPAVDATRVPIGEDIREGLALLWRQRTVLTVLALVAVVSFFGRPYIRLMPTVAREVLQVGPRGLGILQAAPGLGTVLAAVLIGWSVGRLPAGSLMLGASGAMGLLVALFGLSRSFPLSVALLVGVGVSQSAALATANTLIQRTVPPGARGRAMGVFSMVAFGMMAFGTLPAGAVAEAITLPWTFALWGLVIVAAALLTAALAPSVRRL